MANPTVVFRTQSDIEASIVRGLLEAEGIPSVLSSDVSHSVFPLSVNRLGEVRISVHPDQAQEARLIISGYQASSASDGSGSSVNLDVLEDALGCRFKNHELLRQALTHSSWAHEVHTGNVSDNESLEFLGDAIIGFVVADLLCSEYPDSDEGAKSKMKSSLVSTLSLARVGKRLQLGRYIRLGKGEEKTGGRQKLALLADTFEAVIAALYIDSGMEAARACLHQCFQESVDEIRTTGKLAIVTDHKSALQEWLQANEFALPSYQLVSESGPDHQKTFLVEVVGSGRFLAKAKGRSKKNAEQEAARLALNALQSNQQQD